jgi:homoserine dehydrogenase
MTHNRIALLGFGNVGQAFVHLLQQKKDLILQDHNLSFSVTGIATGRHGMAIDPQGIDIESALQLITDGSNLDVLSRIILSDPMEFVRNCGADVLFENTPVNYTDGKPAVDYIRTVLQSGMHAITANKGPVVFAYHDLTRLAEKYGHKFFFESAVMDGAPIFSLFRENLPAANLHGFSGILNSTTNLILCRMEGGESFELALAYAQSIGIAETDPSGDIDGWDSAIKVAALVTVLMDIPLKPIQVDRTGIRNLTLDDVQQASRQGKRWKLVCTAQREDQTVHAWVHPKLLGAGSPFYGVNGTSSIITFETDILTQLSIVEGNPGPKTTAYGLLADFINATR